MTPDIKQQLDAQGIVYKTGKWTEKEKGILRDNVKKYATKHNIADVSTLVLPGKGSGKGSGAAQHPGFYGAVTEGINRPIISVYQCLLRWYRPADITGKFTQAETDKLLKLKALHGHDWKKISEKLGRNPISVKDHARVALVRRIAVPSPCTAILRARARAHTHTHSHTHGFDGGVRWRRATPHSTE